MTASVEDWKAAVYQHRGLPASVKVLLLFLADHMAEDLTVSVPQSQLVIGLGMLRQNVARTIQRACDDGMLRTLEPAHGRRPAIYQGTRRGITGDASTPPPPSAIGITGDASTNRRGITAYASTEPAVDAIAARRGIKIARRGITGDASSCNECNTLQLTPDNSPSLPLQLQHGQDANDTTPTAVSCRVGGAGGGIERPDVEALCKHLADRIESNGAKRPTISKEWRDAARRMLDLDRRPLDEAHELIDWCQDDDFWASNILSMRKFRKQYDQLRGKRLYQRRRRQPQGFTAEDLHDTYAAAAAYDQAHGL